MDHAKCGVVQVESDIVVPVRDVASDYEFATFAEDSLECVSKPLRAVRVKHSSLDLKVRGDMMSLIRQSTCEAENRSFCCACSVSWRNRSRMRPEIHPIEIKNYEEARNEPGRPAYVGVINPAFVISLWRLRGGDADVPA